MPRANTGDENVPDTPRGRTVVVPFCHEVPGGACPPPTEWPDKALVRGTCPRCGKENPKAWRVLKARRLTR